MQRVELPVLTCPSPRPLPHNPSLPVLPLPCCLALTLPPLPWMVQNGTTQASIYEGDGQPSLDKLRAQMLVCIHESFIQTTTTHKMLHLPYFGYASKSFQTRPSKLRGLEDATHADSGGIRSRHNRSYFTKVTSRNSSSSRRSRATNCWWGGSCGWPWLRGTHGYVRLGAQEQGCVPLPLLPRPSVGRSWAGCWS